MSDEDLKEQKETAPAIPESVATLDDDLDDDEDERQSVAEAEGWYKPEGWNQSEVILGDRDNPNAARAIVRPVSMARMAKLSQLQGGDDPAADATSDEAVEVISRGIASWTLKADDDVTLDDSEDAEVICKEGDELPLPRKLDTMAKRRAVVLSLSPKAYNRLFSAIGFVSAS